MDPMIGWQAKTSLTECLLVRWLIPKAAVKEGICLDSIEAFERDSIVESTELQEVMW